MSAVAIIVGHAPASKGNAAIGRMIAEQVQSFLALDCRRGLSFGTARVSQLRGDRELQKAFAQFGRTFLIETSELTSSDAQNVAVPVSV